MVTIGTRGINKTKQLAIPSTFRCLLLKKIIPEKLFSRQGDILWPPGSSDLTPTNCFLCGFLMNRVYTHKSKTLLRLKSKIEEEMSAISHSAEKSSKI